MSQEQSTRPTEQQEPIKYGDVFAVPGELAKKPVSPQDAAMMQAAENYVFGQTQKGGPAAVMQAAATMNERRGFVGHSDSTDAALKEGVTVVETDIRGSRIITESLAGQVVGQYSQPTPVAKTDQTGDITRTGLTIGEALEASAHIAGDKPVEFSDAAAIQAAEARATGSSLITPGGPAASAQSAAAYNQSVKEDADKVKLRDVLSASTAKLPADKVATREDAEGVVSAEMRNDPGLKGYRGGVAHSIAVAARMNERAT